jgi:hypothetical protein
MMCALNSIGTGYGPVAGSFAHNNEHTISPPKNGNFLTDRGKILLMKDSQIHGGQLYEVFHAATSNPNY